MAALYIWFTALGTSLSLIKAFTKFTPNETARYPINY